MLPKLGLRKNNPNIDIGIENLELDNIAYRISAKKPISDIPRYISFALCPRHALVALSR